ncbi:MAG: PKD domain-containing protein [Anaerolineales bacterium]|nr:PKD domain-containing protein [Anaerolineales bacterium]
MKKLVPQIAVALILLGSLSLAPGSVPLAMAQVTPGVCSDPGWELASLSLDGVTLHLCSALLSEAQFAMPEPDNAMQVAAAADREGGFRELTVTAVPFGMSAPTESLSVARAGGAEEYREELRAFRAEQGCVPQPGPTVELFGQRVPGATSVVTLHVTGPRAIPVEITEWVVEAGERLWIVRASYGLGPDGPGVVPGAAAGEDLISLELTSPDLDQPSTSLAAQTAPAEPSAEPDPDVAASAAPGDLPFPSWWDGDCDANNYREASGATAYPLGASYRGLKACGPRPAADRGAQVWVQFFPGARAQIEWQCPEISKRFMWLAYGIKPYQSDGSEVVWNCSPTNNGCWLEKVANGTVGRAPQPGDVLSYGSTSTWGHTSVVMASSVNAAGDGTIRVIEQNSSADGDSVLTVNDWVVLGTVSGWLHDAGNTSVLIAPKSVLVVGPSSSPLYGTQTFTATVSPANALQPVTYVWQVSGQSPVTHTGQLTDSLVVQWNHPGDQTVTVRAANAAGAVTATHMVVVEAPLGAAGQATPLAGQRPLTVAFVDTSTGYINAWLWDFGDGTTSAERNPAHTYTQSGTFPVSLAVSGPGGTDTAARLFDVRVVDGAVASNFTVDRRVGPNPLHVQFSNASAGSITSWQWDFGDGTGATQASPSHRYTTPGAYTVRLTVSGPGGADTVTKQGYIVVGNSRWMPVALAGYSIAATEPLCSDLIVNGGFEQGEGWELPETHYPATYTTALVHAGTRAVQVGIVDPTHNVESYSSARQLVAIPADVASATLRAWLYPLSTPAATLLAPAAGDAQYVLLLSESGAVLRTLLWQLSDERAWRLHEFDVSDYAGQVVKLHFGVYNDGWGASTAMIVDDVAVEVCP